jgi:hypothetical protein
MQDPFRLDSFGSFNDYLTGSGFTGKLLIIAVTAAGIVFSLFSGFSTIVFVPIPSHTRTLLVASNTSATSVPTP